MACSGSTCWPVLRASREETKQPEHQVEESRGPRLGTGSGDMLAVHDHKLGLQEQTRGGWARGGRWIRHTYREIKVAYKVQNAVL